MCLILNKEYPYQQDNVIRYKVLSVTDSDDLHAPYMGSHYPEKEWLDSENYRAYFGYNLTPLDAKGFHVLVNLDDALIYRKEWQETNPHNKYVIYSCVCSGFVAGGKNKDRPYATNEIWAKMKLEECLFEPDE